MAFQSERNKINLFADISGSLKKKPGDHTLKVRVDTGAQGDVFPIRIFLKTYTPS